MKNSHTYYPLSTRDCVKGGVGCRKTTELIEAYPPRYGLFLESSSTEVVRSSPPSKFDALPHREALPAPPPSRSRLNPPPPPPPSRPSPPSSLSTPHFNPLQHRHPETYLHPTPIKIFPPPGHSEKQSLPATPIKRWPPSKILTTTTPLPPTSTPLPPTSTPPPPTATPPPPTNTPMLPFTLRSPPLTPLLLPLQIGDPIFPNERELRKLPVYPALPPSFSTPPQGSWLEGLALRYTSSPLPNPQKKLPSCSSNAHTNFEGASTRRTSAPPSFLHLKPRSSSLKASFKSKGQLNNFFSTLQNISIKSKGGGISGYPFSPFSGFSSASSIEGRAVESNGEAEPRVLVILTGGTICMRPEGVDGTLQPGSLASILKPSVANEHTRLPAFDTLEWDPLYDSSDVGHTQWKLMAVQILKHYEEYSGFVILHGTDTLAYTAAALSFMLENLGKPVVLTGSMLPIGHVSTDAKRNLAAALMAAGWSHLTEVVIAFGSRLMRGNRAVKVDCFHLDAFDSPNYPAIGHIGVELFIYRTKPPPRSSLKLQIFTAMCPNIFVVHVIPSFSVSLLSLLLSSHVRPLAIILMLYGTGTLPLSDYLVAIIKKGIRQGADIVVMTQCLAGSTNLLAYPNGVSVFRLGVIDAKDMTLPSCIAKLGYLMGKGLSGDSLRLLMQTNLRGEMNDHK